MKSALKDFARIDCSCHILSTISKHATKLYASTRLPPEIVEGLESIENLIKMSKTIINGVK